jgi:hypothetical protein
MKNGEKGEKEEYEYQGGERCQDRIDKGWI